MSVVVELDVGDPVPGEEVHELNHCISDQCDVASGAYERGVLADVDVPGVTGHPGEVRPIRIRCKQSGVNSFGRERRTEERRNDIPAGSPQLSEGLYNFGRRSGARGYAEKGYNFMIR